MKFFESHVSGTVVRNQERNQDEQEQGMLCLGREQMQSQIHIREEKMSVRKCRLWDRKR